MMSTYILFVKPGEIMISLDSRLSLITGGNRNSLLLKVTFLTLEINPFKKKVIFRYHLKQILKKTSKKSFFSNLMYLSHIFYWLKNHKES